MNVNQKIEWVCDKICDDYCRWPEEYRKKYKDADEAETHLMEDKCTDCVLDELR